MRIVKRLFDFFYTEFTGVVVLLALVFFTVLIPRVYSARQNSTKVDYAIDTVALAKLMAQEEDHDFREPYKKSKLSQNNKSKLSWAKEKGYKFKSYKQLSEYTGVSVTELKKGKYNELLYPGKYKGLIDINGADTFEWMGLKGVGSKLAKRIVKFRNSLGGFSSINQLKSVWGLDSNIINTQMDRLVLSSNSWKQIAINTAGLDELKKHPYIGRYDAIKIVRFREEHPNMTQKEFMNIKSIKRERLVRMLDYLAFAK